MIHLGDYLHFYNLLIFHLLIEKSLILELVKCLIPSLYMILNNLVSSNKLIAFEVN